MVAEIVPLQGHDVTTFRDALSADDRARFRFLEPDRTPPDGDVDALVAVDGGSVVGYVAHVRHRLPRVGVATFAIAVSPHHRGTGLAQRLIEASLQRAEGAGVRKAVIRMRDDNIAAIRLYERTGFRPEGYFADEEGGHGYYSMAMPLPRSPRQASWTKPCFGADEFREVVRCFAEERYSQGGIVEDFEAALRGVTGADHVVAMSSATSCLTALFHVLFERGERIGVPANTFIGVAHAAALRGLRPVFLDVEPGVGNADLAAVPDDLHGIVPAAMGGHPMDPGALHDLNEGGCLVIEDAAEAIGARVLGRSIGQDHVTVFSFHAAKLVSTVEGGAIATGDADLAARLRRFRNNGETSKFVWGEMGLNHRATDLGAAIGLAQIRALPAALRRRHEAMNVYHRLLGDLFTFQPTAAYVTVHPYMMGIAMARSAAHRKEVFARLSGAGVPFRSLWSPIPTQDPYIGSRGAWKVAEDWCSRSFCLPLWNTMSRDEATAMASRIREAVIA